MGIGNRESYRMVEQPSRRRQECFAENHGRDSDSPNEPVPVIKRFGSPAHRTGEEALVIPGSLTKPIEPPGKAGQYVGYSVRELIGYVC